MQQLVDAGGIKVPKSQKFPSEEDWLEWFEVAAKEGDFDAEPDFPTALALFRDAIQRAKERTDPPFDPPPTFMPDLIDLPDTRLRNWRNQLCFADVKEGCYWLWEMANRKHEGIPPVSTAEFQELADWVTANEERLYQLSLPSYLLDLGNGQFESLANIRYGLGNGVRENGAGELADKICRLRARYGD